MAISSYLRECGYSLGGLLPKIYLIHKNALKLSYKAKGIEVSVNNNKDGDIYLIEGSQCIYREEEMDNGKYRFNSTLEFHINELYQEPFLYGLKTLRTNQYYIVIEDKKGVQYLINPELYTKMTYEYSFSDENGNMCVITYNNLSNHPLLIFENKITETKSLLGKQYQYNYGRVWDLMMFDYKDLKFKDDGVKVSEMYVEGERYHIDYMKESFTYVETYDGKDFITSLSFSIPLDENYGWAYRLIEYEDNRYAAIIRTTNDNYIIIGKERGLIPTYNIETSEEDSVPNIVNIVFEQRSQYPMLWTDELERYRWTEDEPLCFGYDKYQMFVKEKSTDWGDTWVVVEPIEKKKGNIIETNSEDCKEYQWVDDGTYCKLNDIDYEKWENTDSFICENGNKYVKRQKYVSEDGISFIPTDEYGIGDLIEENSNECSYIAVRWVDSIDTIYCDKVRVEGGEYCQGFDLWKSGKTEVSGDGINWYNVGESNQMIEENSCNCGWTGLTWIFNNEYICGSEVGMDIASKYEIWREADGCDISNFTGNIEYRNPQKSYDCGYMTYMWKEDEEDVCYSALPNNVEIVSEVPETNIDKGEYING